MVIRNDDVEGPGLQLPCKRRAVAHARYHGVKLVLLEEGTNQLGKIRFVFQMQNMQLIGHFMAVNRPTPNGIQKTTNRHQSKAPMRAFRD